MYNVTYQYGQPIKNRKRLYSVIALVIVALFAGVVLFWRFWPSPAPEQQPALDTSEALQEKQAGEQSQVTPLPSLQSTVDVWAQSANGKASVVIMDAEGNQLARHQASLQYFTASIYKLYVAYVGYQKVDDGTYSLTEQYLNGKTRGECLDLMIRDSDSPCGEKMWNELGKQTITDKMRALGLVDTSLVNLRTSANDASIVLQNIQLGEGLSQESQGAILDSMKTQDSLYRRGLPSGFTEMAVFNKVGWNLTKEWHDTAIIHLPDGRAVIVSVFSENVGFKKIAELGTLLEAKLTADL